MSNYFRLSNARNQEDNQSSLPLVSYPYLYQVPSNVTVAPHNVAASTSNAQPTNFAPPSYLPPQPVVLPAHQPVALPFQQPAQVPLAQYTRPAPPHAVPSIPSNGSSLGYPGNAQYSAPAAPVQYNQASAPLLPMAGSSDASAVPAVPAVPAQPLGRWSDSLWECLSGFKILLWSCLPCLRPFRWAETMSKAGIYPYRVALRKYMLPLLLVGLFLLLLLLHQGLLSQYHHGHGASDYYSRSGSSKPYGLPDSDSSMMPSSEQDATLLPSCSDIPLDTNVPQSPCAPINLSGHPRERPGHDHNDHKRPREDEQDEKAGNWNPYDDNQTGNNHNKGGSSRRNSSSADDEFVDLEFKGDAMSFVLRIAILVFAVASIMIATKGRRKLREKYNIPGGFAEDCCVHACLPTLAIAQEARHVEREAAALAV